MKEYYKYYLLNSYLDDYHISAEEYSSIEQLLFYDDGFITAGEAVYLEDLDVFDISWESADDLWRVQTTLRDTCFSLNRYIQEIGSRSNKETLRDASLGTLKIDQPSLSFNTFGFTEIGFFLEIEFDGQDLFWQYDGQQDLEVIDDILGYGVFECILGEMDQMVKDSSGADDLTENDKDDLRAILDTLCSIDDAYYEEIDSFPEDPIDEFYQDSQYSFPNPETPYQQETVLYHTPGSSLTLLGDDIDERSREVLIEAASIVSENILEKFSKINCHFVSFTDLQRDYHDSHPQMRFKMGSPAGKTMDPITAGEIDIVINTNLPTEEIIPTFFHELGHGISFWISQALSGQFSPLNSSGNSKLKDVIDYHMSSLELDGPIDVQDTGSGFVSSNAQSNEDEWIATAFESYYLGQLDYTYLLESGILTQSEVYRLKSSHDEFLKKDPVGYLLIASFDQLIKEGHPHPEKVFSWTSYNKIFSYVYLEDHPGPREDQVATWLNELDIDAYDFEVEDEYDEYNSLTREDGPDYFERKMKGYSSVYDRHPDFFPTEMKLTAFVYCSMIELQLLGSIDSGRDKVDPSDEMRAEEIMEIYLRTGEYDKAEYFYQQISDWPGAAFVGKRLYLETNQGDKYLEVLLKFGENDPNFFFEQSRVLSQLPYTIETFQREYPGQWRGLQNLARSIYEQDPSLYSALKVIYGRA